MDSTAAKETLEAYLRQKKLRPTRERTLLLEEIMRTDGHFDADQLYTTLNAKGLKASRATVYNTLDLLVECGLISKYRFGDSHSRYEKAFGRPRHDHLICLECGDIIEFVSDRLDKIQKEVCHENNFTLHNSTLQIFGVCSNCQHKR
jgi:Fur family ferric uptake transcriptional regulator